MVGSPASNRPIRFGVYEVDLRTGELRRQGLRIKLQEKPFQVLAILLEHAGDIVTREELREKLWPEDTFVDFDNSLNTAMSKLREALGESAGSPRYVETLPRRGYRFIGHIEPPGEIASPAPPMTPATDSTASEGSNGSARAAMVAPEAIGAAPIPAAPVAVSDAAAPPGRVGARLALLALAALVALSGWLAWRQWGHTARLSAGKIRLAVLPFQNMSGDPEQDYLSEGLTEEMIAQLGRLQPQRLSVIARTSAMQYRNSQKSIGVIGRELRVEYVVEGSVRRANGRVRITAKLIQVADQMQLWAENYDREAADVLAVQTEVAHRIAAELAVELLPAPGNVAAGKNRRDLTTTPAAYEAYLKGRFFWNKRTEGDIRKSIEYFQQAIEQDPKYAPAWSGLADAYIVLETYSSVSANETLPKARQAALKAIALDGSLAEARNSLAGIRHLEWDWKGAEAEFRWAHELNTNYATAHQWFSELLTMLGRQEEAVAAARRAQEIDPLSVIINHVLAFNLYAARRFDEAIVQYRKTLEVDPTFDSARFALANTYEQKGLYKEAIEEWRILISSAGRSEEADEFVRVFQQSGFPAVLKKRYEQLVERSRRGEFVQPLLMARISLKLGRNDEAFHWLEKAFAERRQRLGYLKVDPVYDPLRKDSRYISLVKRIGLP